MKCGRGKDVHLECAPSLLPIKPLAVTLKVWFWVGDAPGGLTEYSELVYAPGGAKVIPAAQARAMMGGNTGGLPRYSITEGGGPIGSGGGAGNPSDVGTGVHPGGWAEENVNSPDPGKRHAAQNILKTGYIPGATSAVSIASSAAAAATQAAGATVSVAAAAEKISASGAETARATHEQTTSNMVGQAAIIAQLEKMNRFNQHELPRLIASAVARHQ